MFSRAAKQTWNVMLHNGVRGRNFFCWHFLPLSCTSHPCALFMNNLCVIGRQKHKAARSHQISLNIPAESDVPPPNLWLYWLCTGVAESVASNAPCRYGFLSDWLCRRELLCLCHCPHGEPQVPPLPLKSQETPLTALGCFDVSYFFFSSLVFFSFFSLSLSVKLRV